MKLSKEKEEGDKNIYLYLFCIKKTLEGCGIN